MFKAMYACLLVALLMVFAACGGGGAAPPAGTGDTGAEGQAAAPATDTEELAADAAERVTITMAINVQKGACDTEPGWKFQTVLEMEEMLGINLELRSQTPDQDTLMIASRDMPDIFNAHADYMVQLIEGGLIRPLDDLLYPHAPDLLAQEFKLDFARRFLSNGTGYLFGITSFTGQTGNGFMPAIGFFSRWDLYRELGFPSIENADEVLDVVYRMVQMEPYTPDGLPTFGFGVFTDWGMWPFTVYPTQSAVGAIIASNSWGLREDGTEFVNFTDFYGPMWDNLRLLNRSHQLGIFDVDSLTQRSDEYANKAALGQYMVINASWWVTDFNTRQFQMDPDTLVGFQLLPMYRSEVYDNTSRASGAVDWMHVISADSQHPEAAMRLINYLNSYDGIRHLMNGRIGETIELVDGRPEMKQEVIEGFASGDAAFTNLFWRNQNMFGFTAATRHPVDGQPLDLFLTDRAFSLRNTPMDLDYAQHFGALYPYGVVTEMIAQGRMFDRSWFDYDVTGAMQHAPDNIQRIDTLLSDIIFRAAAAAILAPDDDAFRAVFDSTVTEMEASGLELSTEFWRDNFHEARMAIHGN